MLGCIGHWCSQLVYLVPVAVMGGAVGQQRIGQRWRDRRVRRPGEPRLIARASGSRAWPAGVAAS
jgi:hypothetical protein